MVRPAGIRSEPYASVVDTLTAPPPLLDLVRRAEPVTGEELARIPDLGPGELVRGKFIPMSPTNWRHGEYVDDIAHALGRFVRARKLGKVLTGEVGVYTERDPDTVRGADVLFISHERLARVTSQSYLDVAPELVVEVFSPGNTWDEMRRKVAEYLGAGAERVWVVEPERRAVHVYRAPDEATVLGAGDVLRGEGLLEGFALPLDALFGG